MAVCVRVCACMQACVQACEHAYLRTCTCMCALSEKFVFASTSVPRWDQG